ncbi:cobyric acid synthase [Lachnospiraceae bacterium NSJ-143]|nr:cobyric acid synthase [Lachnospiraceae bacterium NSJ-143]
MANPIMIQGTMSSAGKSFIAAALCRIFCQDGYKAAPFKSQNMALNSFITTDGFEIGRAQAMQAEAAGIEPTKYMNPILLKPTTDTGSQVIVNGRPVGNMSAAEYFKYKSELIPDILKAYEELSKIYDVIIIEGAGSPAEINLKKDDIVNMGLAEMLDSPVLLAGDIDRGGVFAQLYGTVMLLDNNERQRVKGIIINKFRGDRAILEPGLKMLEEKCGVPVKGVIPFVNIDIDDEDSLSDRLQNTEKNGIIDIAVIRLPKISNFTDLNSLARIEGVSVRYVNRLNELKEPDLIIIPGSKSTIKDTLWLRQNGLESKIKRLAANGVPVIGICGGYQILGKKIADPYFAEGGGEIDGIGLLDIYTVFESEKNQSQESGILGDISGFFGFISGADVKGYEIHMGNSRIYENGESKALIMNTGSKIKAIGAYNKNVLGTYIHGFFDSSDICRAVSAKLFELKGLKGSSDIVSWDEYKNAQYDLLAETVRKNIDMDYIYKIMGLRI